MTAKKDFTIGKNKTKPQNTVTEDNFINGQEREVSKTFRLPEGLAFEFKKFAVESRRTEKDILIQIMSEHIKAHS